MEVRRDDVISITLRKVYQYPVSKNNLVRYIKTLEILTVSVTQNYELFLFRTYEEQW